MNDMFVAHLSNITGLSEDAVANLLAKGWELTISINAPAIWTKM